MPERERTARKRGTMYTVELKKLVEKMQLENCTPELDIDHILITQPDVNRPALQLAGFFDYFDAERVQIIGNVEHAYMEIGRAHV